MKAYKHSRVTRTRVRGRFEKRFPFAEQLGDKRAQGLLRTPKHKKVSAPPDRQRRIRQARSDIRRMMQRAYAVTGAVPKLDFGAHRSERESPGPRAQRVLPNRGGRALAQRFVKLLG